jgi:hypothetical protein
MSKVQKNSQHNLLESLPSHLVVKLLKMHQCNYVQEKDKILTYKHEGFKQTYTINFLLHRLTLSPPSKCHQLVGYKNFQN